MAIFITSLLSVTLVSVGPRVLEHAAVADVRSALTEATPEERSIRFHFEGRVGAETEEMPFSGLDLRSDELLEQHMPASVAAFVSDRQWVYDSPLFRVRSFPEEASGPDPTTFHFRYQQGIEDRVAVVRGRLPETVASNVMLLGPECPSDAAAPEDFEPDRDQACRMVDVPVVDTAITQSTASELGVDVGDRLTFTPATEELSWRQAPIEALGTLLVVQISGIIELTDPSDEFWFEDRSLHRPSITEETFRVNPRMVYAAGLMMPQQYREFLGHVPAVDHDYSWRFIVTPGVDASANADRFARDVGGISPRGYVTSTLLPELLGEHIAQRRLAQQLIWTSAAGIYWVAIAAIVALALLVAAHRRSTMALVVNRGASPSQLRTNSARTALLVIGLPTVIGWAIAWCSVPGTSSGSSTRSAVVLAIAACAAFVATSVPMAPKSGSGERSRRRPVAEVTIFIVAAGSVYLLRQRPPVGERVDDGLDLLLINTPALVALAAGIVAARFVSPLARVGAAVGSRKRTLGMFVGFRRLVEQPPAARTPVIVMTIAVATAVLSVVLASSIATAQRSAVWHLVGGDYRVQSIVDRSPLPVGLDLGAVNGRPSVSGVEIPNQRIVDGSRSTTVDVAAIEVGQYRSMLDGSGITGVGLDELVDGATSEDVVPVVAVGPWHTRSALNVGDRSMLNVESFRFDVEVVAVVDRFPALVPGRATLLMDLDSIRAATNDRVARPTFVLLDGDDGELPEIAELAADRTALVRVTSRFDRLESIAGDPLSTWTNRSLWAVAAISFILVALAAGSGAATASAVRQRDLMLVRVLGLRSKESRLIAAIEHVPSVVSALALGGVAGSIAGVLLEPALGLSAFGDGGSAVEVELDSVLIAVLVVIAGLAAGLGIAASHQTGDDDDAARLLRVGER